MKKIIIISMYLVLLSFLSMYASAEEVLINTTSTYGFTDNQYDIGFNNVYKCWEDNSDDSEAICRRAQRLCAQNNEDCYNLLIHCMRCLDEGVDPAAGSCDCDDICRQGFVMNDIPNLIIDSNSNLPEKSTSGSASGKDLNNQWTYGHREDEYTLDSWSTIGDITGKVTWRWTQGAYIGRDPNAPDPNNVDPTNGCLCKGLIYTYEADPKTTYSTLEKDPSIVNYHVREDYIVDRIEKVYPEMMGNPTKIVLLGDGQTAEQACNNNEDYSEECTWYTKTDVTYCECKLKPKEVKGNLYFYEPGLKKLVACIDIASDGIYQDTSDSSDEVLDVEYLQINENYNLPFFMTSFSEDPNNPSRFPVNDKALETFKYAYQDYHENSGVKAFLVDVTDVDKTSTDFSTLCQNADKDELCSCTLENVDGKEYASCNCNLIVQEGNMQYIGCADVDGNGVYKNNITNPLFDEITSIEYVEGIPPPAFKTIFSELEDEPTILYSKRTVEETFEYGKNDSVAILIEIDALDLDDQSKVIEKCNDPDTTQICNCSLEGSGSSYTCSCEFNTSLDIGPKYYVGCSDFNKDGSFNITGSDVDTEITAVEYVNITMPPPFKLNLSVNMTGPCEELDAIFTDGVKGKTAYVVNSTECPDSVPPEDSKICECTLDSSGSCSCSFNAPVSVGLFNYTGCSDFDSNSTFDDSSDTRYDEVTDPVNLTVFRNYSISCKYGYCLKIDGSSDPDHDNCSNGECECNCSDTDLNLGKDGITVSSKISEYFTKKKVKPDIYESFRTEYVASDERLPINDDYSIFNRPTFSTQAGVPGCPPQLPPPTPPPPGPPPNPKGGGGDGDPPNNNNDDDPDIPLECSANVDVHNVTINITNSSVKNITINQTHLSVTYSEIYPGLNINFNYLGSGSLTVNVKDSESNDVEGALVNITGVSIFTGDPVSYTKNTDPSGNADFDSLAFNDANYTVNVSKVYNKSVRKVFASCQSNSPTEYVISFNITGAYDYVMAAVINSDNDKYKSNITVGDSVYLGKGVGFFHEHGSDNNSYSMIVSEYGTYNISLYGLDDTGSCGCGKHLCSTNETMQVECVEYPEDTPPTPPPTPGPGSGKDCNNDGICDAGENEDCSDCYLYICDTKGEEGEGDDEEEIQGPPYIDLEYIYTGKVRRCGDSDITSYCQTLEDLRISEMSDELEAGSYCGSRYKRPEITFEGCPMTYYYSDGSGYIYLDVQIFEDTDEEDTLSVEGDDYDILYPNDELNEYMSEEDGVWSLKLPINKYESGWEDYEDLDSVLDNFETDDGGLLTVNPFTGTNVHFSIGKGDDEDKMNAPVLLDEDVGVDKTIFDNDLRALGYIDPVKITSALGMLNDEDHKCTCLSCAPLVGLRNEDEIELYSFYKDDKGEAKMVNILPSNDDIGNRIVVIPYEWPEEIEGQEKDDSRLSMIGKILSKEGFIDSTLLGPGFFIVKNLLMMKPINEEFSQEDLEREVNGFALDSLDYLDSYSNEYLSVEYNKIKIINIGEGTVSSFLSKNNIALAGSNKEGYIVDDNGKMVQYYKSIPLFNNKDDVEFILDKFINGHCVFYSEDIKGGEHIIGSDVIDIFIGRNVVKFLNETYSIEFTSEGVSGDLSQIKLMPATKLDDNPYNNDCDKSLTMYINKEPQNLLMVSGYSAAIDIKYNDGNSIKYVLFEPFEEDEGGEEQ